MTTTRINSRIAGFAVHFGLLAAVMLCFTLLAPEYIWMPLNIHTAAMTARLLDIFGLSAIRQGAIIAQPGFCMEIISECTVLYMAVLYTGFILATPMRLGRKLSSLALGLAALHAVNIMRIALVFAIGREYPRSFEIMHVYLGQLIMVIFLLALCLLQFHATETNNSSKTGMIAFSLRLGAFGSIIFLFWLGLNKEYVRLTDHAVYWLLGWWDINVRFAYRHELYYQTFNVVIFGAVVLAYRGIPYKAKINVLLSGMIFIMGLHIAFRVMNVWMLLQPDGKLPAYQVSRMLFIFGEYLLLSTCHQPNS
jgi:exosortase H (IPTLxxWG-CTERM-specific)